MQHKKMFETQKSFFFCTLDFICCGCLYVEESDRREWAQMGFSCMKIPCLKLCVLTLYLSTLNQYIWSQQILYSFYICNIYDSMSWKSSFNSSFIFLMFCLTLRRMICGPQEYIRYFMNDQKLFISLAYINLVI